VLILAAARPGVPYQSELSVATPRRPSTVVSQSIRSVLVQPCVVPGMKKKFGDGGNTAATGSAAYVVFCELPRRLSRGISSTEPNDWQFGTAAQPTCSSRSTASECVPQPFVEANWWPPAR